MKQIFVMAALLAATACSQYCPSPLDFEGNYYCSRVDAITYTSVGGSGSYDQVTNMDSSSGICSSTPYAYSGSLSPLDEEVTLHVRGPLHLTRLAAYTPSAATTKKSRRNEHLRRHAHVHRHARVRKRDVGDLVTATIDGQVVSWTNEYDGGASTAAPPVASSAPDLASAPTPTDIPSDAVDSSASSSDTPASGNWGRQAYYDSASQEADGIVFLNHFGGTGSGVFDYTFGNSLSYASSDGTTGASSNQTLADTTLASGTEIVIATNQECGDNGGDCGYYRPGTVAYHGFNGPQKAFFFEFEMPDDGGSTSDPYNPVNMPAIWMLNAQIPRTLQYGNAECSCWTSGCGEFDIFEVLTPGYDKAKSTLHGNIAGGSSDYFQRPTAGTIKVGVVLIDDNIHIKVLDGNTDFGSEQAASVIQDIVGSTMEASDTVSLFSLAGAGGG